jgi:hypothetical protein
VTLLTLVQNAQDLISGMARASTIVGNTDPTGRQLLALATEASRSLVMAHPWTVLVTLRTHVTVAAEVQPNFLTTDFDRFVDETIWNTTLRLRVKGPLTAAQYANVKSMGIGPIHPWFRKRGTSILLYPVPAAGQTITYEYVSKQFCASDSGALRSYWGADTDTSVFDERLVSLAIVWMWLARKGLDFSTEIAQYKEAVRAAIAADGGRQTLDMAEMGSETFVLGGSYTPWVI